MHRREKPVFLTKRLVNAVVFTTAISLRASPLEAQSRPKTDVVVLKNGDRITGEIKGLEQGKLSLDTDWMGTVEIEWDNIERVQSAFRFTVALDSGLRIVGALDSGEEVQILAIQGEDDHSTVGYSQVVEISPLEEAFWQRLKGSMDLGFSFAQANTSTQWSLNAQANHRTPKNLASASFTSILQDQEDATRTTRNVLGLGYQRFVGRRWYAAGLSQFQQSESQGLELRGLVGGGIGRHVYQSTKTQLSLIGAADFTREKYAGQNFISTSEAIAGLNFETFRFESPKAEITAYFFAFPNLTTLGRIRLQSEGRVRFQIIGDLYFSVNLYESYDSDPPIEDVANNDFSLSTSLGWNF